MARKTARRRKSTTSKRTSETKRISRLRKPEEMSLEEWQVALRRQYAKEQKYKIKNVGSEPIFSEFLVTNPETEKTYRVAIRGDGLGENHCSCPDFAVNTLGTCKHVEFTLAKLKHKRGGRAAFAAGFQPEHSEVCLKYGMQRHVIFRRGSDCPKAVREHASKYFNLQGTLKARAYSRFHLFLKKMPNGNHEVRCYDDALTFVSQVRDGEKLKRRVDKAFPNGPASAGFNRLLAGALYPYQREGAHFAARTGRCLIADDMGLGKTIEAIAAAEILARTGGVGRVLIISPTSLKQQWEREVERFTDRPAMVIEGLQAMRAKQYRDESFYKITNYDVIYRDLEMIQNWSPDLIILDEAQRIKNWKTRTAKSIKNLQSEFAIVLTGTPLENRLEELYSIVEFVDRFRLGPMFRFLATHQHMDETGRVVGYRNLSAISNTLKPILIRRKKEEVLKELPERLEKRFFVPMTKEQWNHHEENREIVARIVHKWRRYGFLPETDQRRLTCALQNMRMSCNSTYLLDQETDYGCKADELLLVLKDILEDQDVKVVVFSQWLRMHELISERLTRRNLDHVLFHGRVPSRKRKDLIQRFQDDPACRLFLSTDAGGVGLNLHNASVVLIVDQPWNPAVLEQRIGRVHRLGQHRGVRVIHFISQGTIEEGMLELLSFKKSMFSGVLDGGQDEVFLGGTRLKRFMDSVEKVTGAVSKEERSAPRVATPVQAKLPRPMRKKPEEARPAAVARTQQQAMADLVSAGAAFLDQLGKALRASAERPTTPTTPGSQGPLEGIVATDEDTGRPYLKLPLPPEETLHRISEVLSAFTGR